VIVAVWGSRAWKDLRRVERFVGQVAVKHPAAIILSGGARGVDRTAEQAGLRNGLRVASLRPESRVRWEKPRRPRYVRFRDPDRPTRSEEVQYDRYRRAELEYDTKIRLALDTFVIALYEMQPGEPDRVRCLATEYDSFRDAALGRDRMVAELADHGVAFWADNSPGTGYTVGQFGVLGKSDVLTVMEPR
jgi:YspA, cpYpsA-related SLOG family